MSASPGARGESLPSPTEDEQRHAQIRATFRRRRLFHWLVNIALVVAVLAFIVATPESAHSAGGVVFEIVAALLLAAIVATFAVWRCPSCGSYLGRSLSPGECPRCGISFADDARATSASSDG
ncbi:MAG: transposase [Gemmatimonadota bacterium]|nr:transposase [Gemmatimonadota bacterium]